MKHELWKERNGYTFCLAGSMGNAARALMDKNAELIWTVEADSHFEAMTKYYEFMDRGKYKTEFEQDKEPYPEDWTETQK
jgi:hypothetical protein